MSSRTAGLIGLVGLLSLAALGAERPDSRVLKPESFRHYVDAFQSREREGAAAWEWLRGNIPFFESSDKGLEEIYYFRWWTFRKHVKKTPDGFVITEFLPDVPWAGKRNTISCAAGHHFYEGRWLRDPSYLKDYALFWFRKGGDPRLYSFWAADSLRAWTAATGDRQLAVELFPDLAANYGEWEKSHQDANGLFWQIDDRDGMEFSVGGSGHRPTINSYMFGEARALDEIARWAGRHAASQEFRSKAAKLRELVEDRLWDPAGEFYKTLPRGANSKLVRTRELVGYVPWSFGLPRPGREAAWRQLLDPKGFAAPFGPTTAERRDPRYRFENPHECLWNGPSWPFATAQTLTAMANLLNDYSQSHVSKADYLQLLRTYAKSQHLRLADGRVVPWIDENLDPDTGEWLARKLLHAMTPEQQAGKGGKDRGRDYNHSTFNDLIITGLAGLRPRTDQTLEVNPLVPAGAMDYFCLDGVRYHGTDVTILWDRTGERYRKGKGLRVLANGAEIASRPDLGKLSAKLPQTARAGSLLSPEDEAFLRDQARRVVDSAALRPGQVSGEHKNTTSYRMHAPGGNMGYPAFWTRDAVMMLGDDFVPAEEVEDWIRLMSSVVRGPQDWQVRPGVVVPAYAIPDHISFNGLATFYPGNYETGDKQGGKPWGKYPPLDDHFYFLTAVYEHWKLTRSTALFNSPVKTSFSTLPLNQLCDRVFRVAPADPETGLVWAGDIETENAKDFGFCDAVFKSGKLLFPSVLKFVAARQLGELYAAAGDRKKAEAYSAEAARIRQAIPATFFRPSKENPAEGWLHSATGVGNQPDVWGSSYAVWAGAVEGAVADQIARSLVRAYREKTAVREGCVAHVLSDGQPRGWEQSLMPFGEYQNGGHWGTASGWYIAAMHRADPEAAAEMARDYIAFLKRDLRPDGAARAWEWFNRELKREANELYVATVALPYIGLKQVGLLGN